MSRSRWGGDVDQGWMLRRTPVVSTTALAETRVPSARRRKFWRTVPRMSSKTGSSSLWMSRPTLHRMKTRCCGPADASLGRSRPTRSHLRQVRSAADVAAVSSSEKNNTRASNGSMLCQPTKLTTKKRAMREARPNRTRHKYCKQKSTGADQTRTVKVEVSTLREAPLSTDPAGCCALTFKDAPDAGRSLAKAVAVGCRNTLCAGRAT